MAGKKKRPDSNGPGRAAHAGNERARAAPRSYPFRGRTIEIVPPTRLDRAGNEPLAGKLRIDGREVDYEQTDEGVYSHEMTYMRFGTPEELAEELIRQWGTHIPAPTEMPMPDHGAHENPPQGPTRRPGGRHHE